MHAFRSTALTLADPDSLFGGESMALPPVGSRGKAPRQSVRGLRSLKLMRFQQVSNTFGGKHVNIWLISYNIVDQVKDICVRNA